MLFGVILAQHINSKSLPEDIDNNNAYSLDDVFMPKDDAVNASDGEIDCTCELEKLMRFCLLTKP